MEPSTQLFDVTLLATLGLDIFAATLVGAYVRSRRRDVCLRCFEGFHVTLERADGKIIWGRDGTRIFWSGHFATGIPYRMPTTLSRATCSTHLNIPMCRPSTDLLTT